MLRKSGLVGTLAYSNELNLLILSLHVHAMTLCMKTYMCACVTRCIAYACRDDMQLLRATWEQFQIAWFRQNLAVWIWVHTSSFYSCTLRIYVRRCMHLCAYVCILAHVCAHVRICVHICAYVRIGVHIRAYVFTCVHMCAYVYICVRKFAKFITIQACISIKSYRYASPVNVYMREHICPGCEKNGGACISHSRQSAIETLPQSKNRFGFDDYAIKMHVFEHCRPVRSKNRFACSKKPVRA